MIDVWQKVIYTTHKHCKTYFGLDYLISIFSISFQGLAFNIFERERTAYAAGGPSNSLRSEEFHM